MRPLTILCVVTGRLHVFVVRTWRSWMTRASARRILAVTGYASVRAVVEMLTCPVELRTLEAGSGHGLAVVYPAWLHCIQILE